MLEASKHVYTSLLQPSFHYADVAWEKILEGWRKELYRLQNRAAWIILRKNTSNDSFCVLNWLNVASRKKMHKCILVFKCLNNLVPKYLMQYFTRNADLHDHATWRSKFDLHPPKPKCNMGKRTFKYARAIYFNSLPNYVKSATSINSFKKMLTEYFTLLISISHLLAHTFYIDLARFFTVILFILIMYIPNRNFSIVYFFISQGTYGYQPRCWTGYPD